MILKRCSGKTLRIRCERREEAKEEGRKPHGQWGRCPQDSKDFQCKSLNMTTRWRKSEMTAGMFKAKEERKNIVKN